MTLSNDKGIFYSLGRIIDTARFGAETIGIKAKNIRDKEFVKDMYQRSTWELEKEKIAQGVNITKELDGYIDEILGN